MYNCGLSQKKTNHRDSKLIQDMSIIVQVATNNRRVINDYIVSEKYIAPLDRDQIA